MPFSGGMYLKNPKSIIHIGTNFKVYNDKHFCWFHRMMIKWCFGFEVENVEDNNG